MSLLATLLFGAASASPATEAADMMCDNKPVIMIVSGPVHDRERIAAYAKAIADSGLHQRLGGYYLNTVYPFEQWDGEAAEGHVDLAVRFPCMANAKTFWQSEEYRKIREMRLNPPAADFLVRIYPEAPVRSDIVGKVGDNRYLATFDGGAVPAVTRYADPPGLVLGVDADTAPAQDYEEGWATRVVLRQSEGGGYAARITLKTERGNIFGKLPRDYQLYVLEGKVKVAGFAISQGDFLYLPKGTEMGEVSGAVGASYLLFGDSSQDAPRDYPAPFVVRGSEVEWRPGTVAKDAGEEVALWVKPLFTDEKSGARMHLVKSAPGIAVPWEIHPGPEEGYLVEGDYHLLECLPSGLKTFDYNPGGYLYRPGGLMHSGPDSTSTIGSTWLIRTPEKLSAVFYPYCPSAPVSEKD